MIENFGKILMIIGALIFFIGLIFNFKFLGFGKLPGDIIIKRENFTFYFPLASSLIISIILSIILILIFKIFKK